MRLTLLPILILFVLPAHSQAPETMEEGGHVAFSANKSSLYLPLGESRVRLSLIQYGDRRDFFCVNLHDNETTSVQAALEVLTRTGGSILKIENNRQRVIRFRLGGITYTFDPNRMFSRQGIEQSLRENRSRVHKKAIDAIEAFGQRCLSLIPDSTGVVIALHNNTEGAFSVKTYLPGSSREKDAREVYADSLQDEDDIVITTDSLLHRHMSGKGYNSIWQDNIRVRRDGSLSVHYGELNRRYANIETQHGKKEQYIRMLEDFLSILETGKQPLPKKEVPEEKEQ